MTTFNQIPIENIITISVSTAQTGLANYIINNLALFTTDTPVVSITDPYVVYKNASDVMTDWGSNSETYKQASSVFAQSPNILNGNGSLIVIPLINSVATHGIFTTESILLRTSNFDSITNGAFKISIDGGAYTSITGLSFGTNPTVAHIASVIDAALTGASCSASGGQIIFTSDSTGTSSAIAIQAPTSGTDLTGALYLNASTGVAVAGTTGGGLETLQTAIARTMTQVYYGGILAAYTITDDLVDLATYIQGIKKILFVASNDVALLDSGDFVDIYTAGLNQTKCLLHTISTLQNARIMAAAYASRLFSTNFDASNSTLTMNLKDLTGINPSSWTQTQINKAKAIGVDIYGSISGISKVLNFANIDFIDSIFNKIAFISRLEVNYFNTLATTSTKIPQTESGMNLVKNGLTSICKLFVSNAYIASGTWTRTDTFGDAETFKRCIEEDGYYIYSTPISQQDPTERASRVAPIAQIAIKEAGAIHSGNVIVYINK